MPLSSSAPLGSTSALSQSPQSPPGSLPAKAAGGAAAFPHLQHGAHPASVIQVSGAGVSTVHVPPHPLTQLSAAPSPKPAVKPLSDESLSGAKAYYGKRWGGPAAVARAGSLVQAAGVAQASASGVPAVATPAVQMVEKVETAQVLKSVSKRCLKDVEALCSSVKRLLLLPISIYEAVKLRGLSADALPNEQAAGKAIVSMQEGFKALAVAEEALEAAQKAGKGTTEAQKSVDGAKKALQNAKDGFVKATLLLNNDYQALKTTLEVKLGSAIATPDEIKSLKEKMERIENTAYAKYALQLGKKGEMVNDLKSAIRWYIADGLGIAARILECIGDTGFPGIAGVAKLLGFIAEGAKALLEGKGLLSEVRELSERHEMRGIASKAIQDRNLDPELKLAAKHIKQAQGFKEKVVYVLKGMLEVGSFALLAGGVVAGALALCGVITATASVVLFHLSAFLGAIVLPIAAGYLIYRLGRWTINQIKMGQAEMTLAKSTDPVKQEKAVRTLMKKDGRFASYRLLERLKSAEATVADGTKNFLKGFEGLTAADWFILDNAGEADWDGAAELIGKRLNLI